MGGVSHYGAPWNSDILTLNAAYEYLNVTDPYSDPATYALPPLDESDPAVWPPCAGLSGNCTVGPYTVGVASNPPIFLPWTSPAYSNNGLTLLGLAIANITGKSIHEVYQESIFDPLNLASSYSRIPPDSEASRFVIAGDPQLSWAIDNGLSAPSGGLFSTLNDLAKFGVGVLNSTLLSETQTRRWLKPVTHTSDLHYSIGKPWEIYRYIHPTTGLITDIYTKLGDSGYYGSLSAFLPDFDAGFSIITASSKDTRSDQTLFLIQQIVDTILPALTAQAAAELQQNYAGTYVSTDSNLNTTITFAAAKHSAPGLVVAEWISNGTNLGPLVPTIMRGKNYRLRPAISTSEQVAFRAVTPPQYPIRPSDPSRLFTSFYDIGDWTTLDMVTYGNINLPLFVFDIDSKGKAEAVSPAAWRVNLERKE